MQCVSAHSLLDFFLYISVRTSVKRKQVSVFDKLGEKDLVLIDLTNLVHVCLVQLHHFYNNLLFISFLQKSTFFPST